jgi:hypothetical protein
MYKGDIAFQQKSLLRGYTLSNDWYIREKKGFMM